MVVRTLFIIGSILLGFTLGSSYGPETFTYGLLGGLLLGLLGIRVLRFERMMFSLQFHEALGGFTGFSIGICLSGITSFLSQQIFLQRPEVVPFVTASTMVGFCSLGLMLGIRMGRRFSFDPVSYGTDSSSQTQQPKILDTSSIIDGRIADLSRTGFLEGPLLIPQFVLHELTNIETSNVQIVDVDFPQFSDVDNKLVAMAKLHNAKIVTTDMNLNKVASVQGISILNTHELSNAMRPAVLPGESLKVFLLREGKEVGQGVAHLDDGTMVIVDHAKRWIGKHVEVVVTSVIQTNAGRMIFSSLREGTPRLQASYG